MPESTIVQQFLQQGREEGSHPHASSGQSAPQRPYTRRDFLETTVKAGAAAFTTGLLPNLKADAAGTHNVLFIFLDDMQPLLGCYGHSHMHTPNLDALAQRGTVFNRAYCQYPLCNPSRASILTGLRPDTTGVKDNMTFFRDRLPGVVTLPQQFKEHGYHTESLGRVGHAPSFQDDAFSWSVPSWKTWWTPTDTSPSWAALDVADNALRDGRIAARAVETLAAIQHSPFFLAVGFRKPHFPLESPQKYYDLYDPAMLSLPKTLELPQGSLDHAYDTYNTLGVSSPFQCLFDADPMFVAEDLLELVHAYAAAISFVDAQVGQVLQQIESLGLAENTVVVVVSDQGQHIGEHGILGKGTLFQYSLHSPLIISVPGQASAGVRTDALAELVDIYPTLCEACDVPTRPELEGRSLMPVVAQPTRPWKTGAFSQTVRYERYERDAYSIRTARYRYTEWGPGGSIAVELFDYETDPYETRNIAMLPENSDLVADLKEQLYAGWWAALPDATPLTGVSQQPLRYDVNNDGGVDFRDLIRISDAFGESAAENPKLDVNGDGQIDIADLLIVAAHLGESGSRTAPPLIPLKGADVGLVETWVAAAQLRAEGSDVFQRGVAALESLINGAIPTETVLLPNYPNPFNPETWIPYDLGHAAAVRIGIYNVKGESIRQLSLGFQAAGTYRTRARAAYWDGRNGSGEPVAGGIYFYSLSAGGMRATRKMVILK